MYPHISKKIGISTIIITLVYIVIVIGLMNFDLVKTTIWGAYSLNYKLNLLFALFVGMWTSMSKISLLIFIMIAVLTGVNLSLIVQYFKTRRAYQKMSCVVGGSSFLGIMGIGCASCGLPILALLGLSGVASYLPFQGTELSFFMIIVLSISLYILIKKYKE